MRVFIDTNIIRKENFLKSSTILSLLKACKLFGFEVHIPEIVVDEIKGIFAKEFSKSLDDFQKQYKKLSAFCELDTDDLCLEEEIKKFIEWLDEQLDNYNVHIIPYKNISAQEVVQQSYLAKKPFKEDGKGYKDFLVWSSISSVINALPLNENYFITNNTRDFCSKCEETNNHVLHPDLVKTIKNKAHSPKVYKSVHEFFEEKISIRFENIDITDVPDLSSEFIRGMVEEIIIAEIPYYSAYGFEGLAFKNDVMIDSVEDISVDDISLKVIDEENILIVVNGSFWLYVSGYIEKFEYYHIRDGEIGVDVLDANHNDHVMSVGSSLAAPFEMVLYYNFDQEMIVDHNIELPSEIMDEGWY